MKGYQVIATASPEPISCDDVDTWWALHRTAYSEHDVPIDRAVVRAFYADRPAWAFASGYQEALRRLFAGIGEVKVALCATEEGGAHPRAIRSTLRDDGDGFRLDGAKRYTTLGTHADEVIVFASVGEDEAGRNRLAAVRVPTAREGITLTAMPDTPFVPEVPHAQSRFENVRVEASERLAGDGYSDYLKPFRTVEDIHVHAAIVAWLVQVGRRCGWPGDAVAELISIVLACRELSGDDPSDVATHITLGGLIRHTGGLIRSLEPLWERVDPTTRQRWLRDRVLLGVAGSARKRRLEAAWRRAGWPDVPTAP